MADTKPNSDSAIDPALSTYAKQSRIRARGGLQLVAVTLAITAVVYWRWGFGPWIKLLLALAGLFAIGPIFTFTIAPGLIRATARRRAAKARLAAPAPVREFSPNHDFEQVRGDDQDYLERRILVDDQPFAIRISQKLSAENMRQTRIFAQRLLADPRKTMQKFYDFKLREAQKMPNFAEEIKKLEIDYIWLGPKIGEITFTEESGGEPWTAAFTNDDFCNLQLEN
ncbi:MAG: hypothetical protein ABSH39_20605 [Candidatus Acidiferrum sp.]|jgi:hypothetical protein